MPVIQEIEAHIGGRNYWQLSYSEICWLFAAVENLPSKITVETGVGSGSSSLAILKASEDFNGMLYSFDLGIRYGESPERPVGFLVPPELRNRWILTIGDSKKTLPEKLNDIGQVDIFFHDSEHTYEHVMFELDTILPRMKRRFLIAVDNYDWTDAPRDFASKHDLNLLKMADDMCFIYPKI